MQYVSLPLFLLFSLSLFGFKGHDKDKVRLIVYGGAREINSEGKAHKLGISHNNTFGKAAFALKKEYLLRNDAKVKVVNIDTGKEFIEILNKQKENSIISLDIITHGSSASINMSYQENTNCGIYTDASGKDFVERIHKKGYHFIAESRSIFDIDFSRFSDSATIEFHGCRSAKRFLGHNSIAHITSLLLQKAGKKQAIVIGHVNKSEPFIKKTDKAKADYRCRKRAIYAQGKRQCTIRGVGDFRRHYENKAGCTCRSRKKGVHP